MIKHEIFTEQSKAQRFTLDIYSGGGGSLDKWVLRNGLGQGQFRHLLSLILSVIFSISQGFIWWQKWKYEGLDVSESGQWTALSSHGQKSNKKVIYQRWGNFQKYVFSIT